MVKLFKNLNFLALMWSTLTLEIWASTDSDEDRCQTIKILNYYIEQKNQRNDIEATEQIKDFTKYKTLKAHHLIIDVLIGRTLYLSYTDYMFPLSCKTLNSQPELIAQFLSCNGASNFQQESLLYLSFNFFTEKESSPKINLSWIANILLDLAVNDLHLPPLRKTSFTKYIFIEAAEHASSLPKNNNNLLYAQHITSLLYYYNYLSLIINHLYHSHPTLISFEAIYSHLASNTYKTYHYSCQDLITISDAYKLILPDTKQSVKNFIEKAGLTPEDIQDLLALKLPRRMGLSQLWSFKEPQIEVKWEMCISEWEKWSQAILKHSFFIKQISQFEVLTGTQDLNMNFNLLIALPYMQRENLFKTIVDSYELSPGCSDVPFLLNALLCIRTSKWPELISYIKPFIFSTTTTINKSIMVKAFKNVAYIEWEEFSKACLQLAGKVLPLEQPEAITILSEVTSYNWQQFNTYVTYLIPQNINSTSRLTSMKLLSQLSPEEWQSIARLIGDHPKVGGHGKQS